MVSTRQSSNVSASTSTSSTLDQCVAGTSSDTHHVNHHIGKVLRSSLIAQTPQHPPQLTPITASSASSNVNVQSPQLSSTNVETVSTPQRNINLLDFPPELLEKIFSYLGYKNVAHLRMVCRQLDKVCGVILNSTFQRLQHQMLNRFQSIKAKMPRRESARRNHPLACESDIIETLHMRLTLLQMTFGKHIERKHCCFFAGEILDEVNRILHYVEVTPKLARPYKVTDELFDLSTMAMEFFKEHIEPTLPEIAYFATEFIDFTFSGSSPSSKYFALDSPTHGSKGYESPTSGNEASSIEPQPVPQSNMVLRKRIRKIKQGMKRYNNQLTVMKRDLKTCKSKIAEQQKQILEYASRMDEYDKKNEETSRKFSTLLQELNKCKTELQYWRSKTPAIPSLCSNCGHANFIPTPSDDLQSLSNGVSPEGLGLNVDNNLPLEGIEFPSEASTSNVEELWSLYEPKKDEKLTCLPTESLTSPKSTSNSKSNNNSNSSKSMPATSKPGCSTKNMKRKNSDDEQQLQQQVECKKQRRGATKSRSSVKRIKT